MTRLSPQALDPLVAGRRRIVRIAGFFADEGSAQRAMSRLHVEAGLQRADVLLLRPADGVPERFDHLCKLWTERRLPDKRLTPEHAPAGAIIGALSFGVLSWLSALFEDYMTAGAVMTSLLVGVLSGAVFGWSLVSLLARRPARHKFDRSILNQLVAGQCAVIVLEVPPQRQPEVLALVRGSSRGWCAEAPRAPR